VPSCSGDAVLRRGLLGLAGVSLNDVAKDVVDPGHELGLDLHAGGLTFSYDLAPGRGGATRAAATFGFCRTQATASWAIDRPASSAIGLRPWTRVRTLLFMNRLIMSAPPFSSVAREPSGGCWPGWYLPVSTPCAMGLQTIWLTPSSSQAGTTSPSMTRHSMEYCAGSR